MNRFDADAEVWRLVPKGADRGDHVAGCEQCTSTMVDDGPVGPGEIVPVESGIGISDDCPRVRVGGNLAGDVPRVKLSESRVDVVKVEYDGRCYPFIGVELKDLQHIELNRVGLGA